MLIHWIGCIWYIFVARPDLVATAPISEGSTWVDVALDKADN